MTSLHRNKFSKAWRQEEDHRLTQGESPNQRVEDVDAEIGADLYPAVLKHTVGTNDLDKIVMRFTDIIDFEVVVACQPLFSNTLYRQLAFERKIRAAEC